MLNLKNDPSLQKFNGVINNKCTHKIISVIGYLFRRNTHVLTKISAGLKNYALVSHPYILREARVQRPLQMLIMLTERRCPISDLGNRKDLKCETL